MTTPEQRRKYQDAVNIQRAIRKALGLCRQCGKPAADGTLCTECQLRANDLKRGQPAYDPIFGEDWVLYCLCHPDMNVDALGAELDPKMIFYVGISQEMQNRIMRHLYAADSDQDRPVTQWIKSLPTGPILVIIAVGYKTFEQARIAEDNAIEKLRAQGAPLLNRPTAKERAALKEKTA